MEITEKWLRDRDVCEDAIRLFRAQPERNAVKILKILIARNKLEWACRLIVRIMTYRQRIAYVICIAEQVLPLFEERYPDDKRPRQTIETAKKCLKRPSRLRRNAAAKAADDVAKAADEMDYWIDRAARAAEATDCAVRVAKAATIAARATHGAASCAANKADYSGAFEAVDCAARAVGETYRVTLLKILRYGESILNQSENLKERSITHERATQNQRE